MPLARSAHVGVTPNTCKLWVVGMQSKWAWRSLTWSRQMALAEPLDVHKPDGAAASILSREILFRRMHPSAQRGL